MGFHEGFWLITGTAAPVVALAVVVSLGDSQKEFLTAQTAVLRAYRAASQQTAAMERQLMAAHRVSETKSFIRDVVVKSTFRRGRLLYWVGASNLLLQAALLSVSLVSVANSANLVPPWLATVAAVAGVLLLAFSTLAVARLRGLTTFGLDLARRESPAEVEQTDPGDT